MRRVRIAPETFLTMSGMITLLTYKKTLLNPLNYQGEREGGMIHLKPDRYNNTYYI
jgi:hypothetical protein